MLTISPLKLEGPWSEGFALDSHTVGSQYLGDDAFGHPQFETTRSQVGELLFQLKYRSDKSGIGILCQTACDFVKSRGWQTNFVVPVPPSRPGRHFQPVPLLAKGVGGLLGLPVHENCVAKVKRTSELKSIFDYQKRMELLNDAYAVVAGSTKDRAILLIDDLYRSGATLEAVTKSLLGQGQARKVFALTFTRTRSHR